MVRAKWILWTGCGVVMAAGSQHLVANTIIDLTQASDIQNVGTYTYYSRAAGVDPFTTAFYPGSTSSGYRDGALAAITTGGAAISFKTGELTNGSKGSVSSWQGVISAGGNFDVVFDLGASYVITSVVVTYADFSGFRWIKTVDAQQVYLSGDAPVNGNQTSFATGTFVDGSDTTAKTYTFSGVATEARYVDFRGAVSASNVSNNGGVLYQVQINGYAVPEISSLALLSISGLMLLRKRG